MLQELKAHPCFIAITEHKWNRSYGYLHGYASHIGEKLIVFIFLHDNTMYILSLHMPIG